jgi:hypothetical protein
MILGCIVVSMLTMRVEEEYMTCDPCTSSRVLNNDDYNNPTLKYLISRVTSSFVQH